MAYQKTICIDFDGTIVDHEFPWIGKLKPGVREALQLFRALGYRILISSCRTSNWHKEEFGHVDEGPAMQRPIVKDMIEALNKADIPYDVVDDGSKGKPFADLYIDDKGLRFQDNWAQIAAWVAASEER